MFAHMCINKIIRESGIDIDAERKLLRRENVKLIGYIDILLPIQLLNAESHKVLCFYDCKSVHKFWKDCTCVTVNMIVFVNTKIIIPIG